MTMWMDLINDHTDYNSMGDSYCCNIGIYAWYITGFFLLNQPFLQCLLNVDVKDGNTLKESDVIFFFNFIIYRWYVHDWFPDTKKNNISKTLH